jgi:hypothetical protein
MRLREAAARAGETSLVGRARLKSAAVKERTSSFSSMSGFDFFIDPPLSFVGLAQGQDARHISSYGMNDDMQAVMKRPKRNQPFFTIILAIIANSHGFMPHKILDRREINAVFSIIYRGFDRIPLISHVLNIAIINTLVKRGFRKNETVFLDFSARFRHKRPFLR